MSYSKGYIYSVYFYNVCGYGPVTVYPAGLYCDFKSAKNRLSKIIPEYQKHNNNTVTNNNKVGWINYNSYGDLDTDLSANQPHSSISLFDE